jgi:hypothetical protein
MAQPSYNYPLSLGWYKTLPYQDRRWVSKALFKFNSSGKAEVDWSKVDRMWFYPPQPSLVNNLPPRVDRYFAQRLFVWMPRKLWKVRVVCTNKDCNKHELTGAGLYHRVRQVFDLDTYYNLASEYLECTKCKSKYIGWSLPIVKQLSIGHQMQFPIILTHQYACDIRVIRLMRQRGLGNSSTQVAKKLQEQHSEKWLQKTSHYLTDAKAFMQASKSGLSVEHKFPDVPPLVKVPTYQWLLCLYARDVGTRIDDVKAAITSTFGQVLKMDSTKKVKFV